MKYHLGDSWTGKAQDGQLFSGTIEKVSISGTRYYIRWVYDKSDEDDRTYWYHEGWLSKFLREQGMESKEVFKLDEELFTL